MIWFYNFFKGNITFYIKVSMFVRQTRDLGLAEKRVFIDFLSMLKTGLNFFNLVNQFKPVQTCSD